jgi:hypothetical protein
MVKINLTVELSYMTKFYISALERGTKENPDSKNSLKRGR